MTVIYLQHPTICHGGWHHIRSFSPPLHPLWGLFEPLTAAGDTATLCLGDEWVPNGCGAWLKKNHWCPDLKKTRLTWLNKYAFHDVHGLSLWKKKHGSFPTFITFACSYISMQHACPHVFELLQHYWQKTNKAVSGILQHALHKRLRVATAILGSFVAIYAHWRMDSI